MHGISKAKHEHLLEALLQLQKLLAERRDWMSKQEGECPENIHEQELALGKQVEEVKKELEQLFEMYSANLESLAHVIAKYDELYGFVRIEYVGKILKELRRQIRPTDSNFQLLRDSIQTVYRT